MVSFGFLSFRNCFLFFIVANIINIFYILYTLLFVDWGKERKYVFCCNFKRTGWRSGKKLKEEKKKDLEF